MPEIVGRLRPPRLAAAPSAPVVGEMYYDTAWNTSFRWNGSQWKSSAQDWVTLVPTEAGQAQVVNNGLAYVNLLRGNPATTFQLGPLVGPANYALQAWCLVAANSANWTRIAARLVVVDGGGAAQWYSVPSYVNTHTAFDGQYVTLQTPIHTIYLAGAGPYYLRVQAAGTASFGGYAWIGDGCHGLATQRIV